MDILARGIANFTGKSGRSLSPALWSNIPLSQLDPNSGIFIYEDFNAFKGSVSTNVGAYYGQAGPYTSYEDTGNAIAQLATDNQGVIQIETDATDNDESWLQWGSASSNFLKVSTSSPYIAAFECRVQVDQVASGNFFVGAGEEALAAADTITDAGALASKDLIGFQCAEGTPTSIDFVHRCAGQSAVQVKVGAGTAAAATWVKLGFIYLPNNPTTKKIIAYVDNVEVGTYVTSTNLAAATFPLDQALSPLFGVKNSTTVAKKLKVDWWAAFQQFAD